jgi:hypothetical protein
MTTKEQFEMLYAEFVPQPDDAPNAIPFYRTAYAIRTLWGVEFVEKYPHIWHQAACYSSDAKINRYQVALNIAWAFVNDCKVPSAPTSHYCTATAIPVVPTEADALAEYRRQYKRAYPDKRVTSTHAKALWLKKKDAAMKIVVDRYHADLDAYNLTEAREQARRDRQQREWMNQVMAMAQLEDAVRELPVAA